MKKKQLQQEIEELKRRVAWLEASRCYCHCYKYVPYYPPAVTWTTSSIPADATIKVTNGAFGSVTEKKCTRLQSVVESGQYRPEPLHMFKTYGIIEP